jgi:hypothetical protein
MHLTEQAEPTTPNVQSAGLPSRVLSICALAAVVTGFPYVAHGLYEAAVDSWIVPINLSPDNDMVLQVNVQLSEQLLERSKLKAESERIESDVRGIDVALARLDAVKKSGQQSLRWTTRATEEQSASLKSKLASLRSEGHLLQEMHKRAAMLVGKTQKNVEQGLVAQQDDDREEQTLSQLEVTVAATERELRDTQLQSEELHRAVAALQRGAIAEASGMLPELVDHEEREARVELETIKLESEKRSLLSQKAVNDESIAKMDEMLAQLSKRPIYRAVQASTDVAFVPYTQLKGVTAGQQIVQCSWLIFNCRTVGRVAEVLPGEVVAQDPWSDVARGQYAILNLPDHEAAQEKVLRVVPRSSR